MLGDAVDGRKQLVHASNHRDFSALADAAQPPVASVQPGIDSKRDQDWHPQSAPESCIPKRDRDSARKLSLPGLVQSGYGERPLRSWQGPPRFGSERGWGKDVRSGLSRNAARSCMQLRAPRRGQNTAEFSIGGERGT